jgi:hypothetical protein
MPARQQKIKAIIFRKNKYIWRLKYFDEPEKIYIETFYTASLPAAFAG